jgi:histidinol dehydrogenase
MLRPLEYSSREGAKRVDALIHRQFKVSSQHEADVREILSRVRSEGDEAVVRYTQQFDCPDFGHKDLQVVEQDFEHAYSLVGQDFLTSLRKAVSNIRDFHRHQVPKSWIMTRENGTILGQMVHPVDAAGLYVPGGRGGETPLVSSVLMNAVPAVIAGVGRLVLATPPNSSGDVNPYLLVAASEVGVREIYKMGSAWAIAAMAFGTQTIAPVDVVVGPGNIYVTLAKKMVTGVVGIDMIAGPSEVLIIADADAPPEFIAADLLSQAEHDPMATPILVTPSMGLAEDVSSQLTLQLERLERRDAARKSLQDNGLLLVVEDLVTAAEISNRIGPEHLELMVVDPWGLLPRIRHAGAVFLGSFTPEPIGDYVAGPNHVLPTMGTARFSSALGVETFLKRSSVISYTENAFRDDADDVIRLAGIEGLSAHANSIRVRNRS